MAVNYASPQPRDTYNETLVGYPAAKVALARYGTTVTTSSVVTLTDNTTVVEVEAVGGNGVAIKWIATGDTQASVISSGASANFDHIVPGGMTRRFVVPVEKAGTTSIVGVNKAMGLYNRLAWTQATTSSSVFSSEF